MKDPIRSMTTKKTHTFALWNWRMDLSFGFGRKRLGLWVWDNRSTYVTNDALGNRYEWTRGFLCVSDEFGIKEFEI